MCFTSSFPKCGRRPSSRPYVGFHPLVFAIFAAFALAAAVSPPSAIPHTIVLFSRLRLAWDYFCSTLLGAAPFLAIGALAAATGQISKRTSDARVLVMSLLLPGCDCTINSLSNELRKLPRHIAAVAVTWGTCCNPLALASTYMILGPHLTLCRAVCGAAAALATAGLWVFGKPQAAGEVCACEQSFSEAYVSALSHGLGSFSIASAIACSIAAVKYTHLPTMSGVVAATLGALLSPCSTSDSLLARVFFTVPKCQLAFVVAASCFDVRQIVMLARSFGPLRTLIAIASSAGACALGYVLA